MQLDLSHLGLIRVSGTGAKNLLQGQLTCNLDDINTHQTRLGAHCNPQGRMLSLFRLFLFKDNYYLQMPREILPDAITALQKYAVFFKVSVMDASSELFCSYQSHVNDAAPSQVDEAIPTATALTIKLPGMGFEIISETPNNIEHTSQTINQWKLINIQQGIPTLYQNTVGKLLPHEVNLPSLNGVSFNKGCYTGQEIIARMQYRGQLKKQLFHCKVKTSVLPLPGTDTPAGMVVDACYDTDNICHLLLITDKNAVATEQLYLDPDKTLPLEFIPFALG